jgi:catechol 2,3-dioxygenase-like lactoylglutathione lyase family enzyme
MTITTRTGTIGLFEMVLEVADLARSEHFYHQIVGLPIANRWDPSDADGREATFLEIGPHAFLGLWPPETGDTAIANGRGGAHVHFALLVEYGTLTTVCDRLITRGVEITAELDFGDGNHAIYFSDPDGHVVELTERKTDWAGAVMRVSQTPPQPPPRGYPA